MKDYCNYRMKLRPRNELETGLVLYDENEPPEMQIENLWKIVDRNTGEELPEPRIDFSEFSKGDIMYPSMMKPEVKRRWDQKQYEHEEAKASFAKLKRMIHAQFMEQNPDLPVVRKLKQTTYGNEIQDEFKKHVSNRDSMLKPGSPQTGTGESIRNELEQDNVDINKIADEVLQFLTPEPENIYALLAVNRDEYLRIEDKLLVSSASTHILEYGYDEGGHLQNVKYCGEPVEIYRYNQLGQRTLSQVAGGNKLEYQYNNLGQLVRTGDTTYVYDQDGALSEKNSSKGVTKYEYLTTGQLCEVHLPDGKHIEYRFDERGFRTSKYINGQLFQRYQWKDLAILIAVEEPTGVSRFHYNKHGRCMGMECNGQILFFATDQLGCVFSIADSSGNSVQEVLYDSFGRRILNSNPKYDLVLGFAGGLYDSHTGLTHFGYREYDPVIGRFLSPDPLGLMAHSGMHGAFGGGDIGGRAHSNLGANKGKNKDTSKDSPDSGSNKSIGHGGIFGAFGTGNITQKAHSNLGVNGNKTNLKNTGNQTGSSLNELGGYAAYTGYAGPSFAEYLGKGLTQSISQLAETSDLWGGKAAAAQERKDKMRKMAKLGSIKLKNNTTSPLTETVDKAQQAKTEGGVGTSTITGKSSAQHVWEMESLAKANATTNKTNRDTDQHIAIGKSAVRRSLLTENAKKQQAKTDMLATKNEAAQAEEGGVLDALGRMANGIGTAVSRTLDTLQGDEDNAIKFGSYVSPEKRAMYNTMMKGAKNTGLDYSIEGFRSYGPVGLALGMAGTSLGMLQGLGDAVQDKPQNEAAEEAQEHFRDQRNKVSSDYFDNLKNNYRK